MTPKQRKPGIFATTGNVYRDLCEFLSTLTGQSVALLKVNDPLIRVAQSSAENFERIHNLELAQQLADAEADLNTN